MKSTIPGLCEECGCDWSKHLHVTYEYRRDLTQIPMEIDSDAGSESLPVPTRQSAMAIIDHCISNLKKEDTELVQICAKLSQILSTHAINPFNDDIIEYIHQFIREERKKQNAGANNDEVIQGLENMVAEYRCLINTLEQATQHQTVTASVNRTGESVADEIFTLIETLYNLPLNGIRIRQQVEGLRHSQDRFTEDREYRVILPPSAASSSVMIQLQSVDA